MKGMDPQFLEEEARSQGTPREAEVRVSDGKLSGAVERIGNCKAPDPDGVRAYLWRAVVEQLTVRLRQMPGLG